MEGKGRDPLVLAYTPDVKSWIKPWWLGLPKGSLPIWRQHPDHRKRQHSGGPLVVSCGQYVRRAANVCQ